MSDPSSQSGFDPLRRRALDRLRDRLNEPGEPGEPAAGEMKKLVHELDVYQAELEVQNDDLRQTQLRLSEALERYQDLFERAPVGYLVIDSERTIRQANQAAAMLCFRDSGELDGLKFPRLIAVEGQDKFWLLLQGVVITGRVQGAELQIQRPGSGSRWVRVDAMLHDRSQGSAGGFRLTLTDITARREAEAQLAASLEELRQVQEELLRRERLAVLGQFASSVAHELRSPLAVVRNGIFFLEHAVAGESGAVRETFSEMRRAVSNSDHIIGEMLDYVREPQCEPTVFAIHRAIADALQSVPLPQEVRLLTGGGESFRVKASRDQITRILQNLIQNAVQAMPQGGDLEVVAEETDGKVCVRVRDTGCGIPRENLERVFEPLFSTKVKGIGLGLAIARRYAELNEGTLTVESEYGKGTAFRLLLRSGG